MVGKRRKKAGVEVLLYLLLAASKCALSDVDQTASGVVCVESDSEGSGSVVSRLSSLSITLPF